MTNLTDVSSHYEFGENWRSYAELIDEPKIAMAIAGLTAMLRPEEISGRSFLDIGCGSGLHSLAAIRLGARSVTGIDIDPNSVATTQAVLQRFASDSTPWTAETRSVFNIADLPSFDIVYSWGVLHHTGDMNRAIVNAADHVAPCGLFALALYRKTTLCGFWRWEKRLYTGATPRMRAFLDGLYNKARALTFLLRGRSYAAYKAEYFKLRGMDYMTDVRDWLGGYPYESISEAEMLTMARELGFTLVRSTVRKNPGLGLLGSGCDEYVFQRKAV